MNFLVLLYTMIVLNYSEIAIPSEVFCHDFHISRSEINYDRKSGDLQIACHIYIDDLERALELMGQRDLFLCSPKEVGHGDMAIQSYLDKKIIIKASAEVLHPTLLGKETSDDKLAVWCYLEIAGLKQATVFNIENKLLLEVFNDQKNILDFTVDKKKKHFTIFDSKYTEQTYKL